ASDFKNKIYNELAVITKAIANPNRLRIIELLAQAPSPVEYVAKQTGLSIANTSQHLQTLKAARLVTIEKRGKYSFYALANEKVFKAWSSLRELGFSQNAEIGKLVQDYRTTRQSLESVGSDELLSRIENENVLVLDVRPNEEYEAGHIAFSVSIPRSELLDKLKNLPKDKEIVAYCRGPLCAMADDAVQILREHGFNAKRLEFGFPEWEAKGLPVQVNGTKNSG
ncbi:MAG: metalloregulator ArsR/SmtB family transcription factor, partial [Gracilimonas sp.]